MLSNGQDQGKTLQYKDLYPSYTIFEGDVFYEDIKMINISPTNVVMGKSIQIRGFLNFVRL